MGTLSTDDASRRLEFVWLGQVENPWLVQARIKLWGLAAGLTVALSTAVTLPLSVVLPPVVAFVIGGAAGALLAVVATWRLSKHISSVTPISYHANTFMGELYSPRTPTVQHIEVALPARLFLEHRTDQHQLMSITAPSVGDTPKGHQ